MTKRSAGDDVADFEKKLHKQNYNDTQRMLWAQCQTDPLRAYIAGAKLSGLNTPAHSPKNDKAWPNTYGVLNKLPKNIKQQLILQRVPKLTPKPSPNL